MKSKYLFIGITLVAALAACSDDDASSQLSPAVVPASVSFNLPDNLQKLVYTDGYGTPCLPLVKGESINLSYTISPDNVTFKDVVWSSSNPQVASVDGNGTVTALSGNDYSLIEVAPEGIFPGSGINASLKVVVSNQMINATDVAIFSSQDEVYAGDTLHLSASILPSESTYKTVEWSSSDESVASIDSKGVLTAKTSSSVLTPVTITASTLDGSGVKGSKVINVRQIVQPQSVAIDQSFSVENGYLCAFNEKNITLQYTTVPAECTTSLIQWTSSDETIATVDNGIVTFTGFGPVTITATCPETKNSSSININVPAGLLRETFHNPNHYIFYDAAQSGNGTQTSHEWHDGFITITTYSQNATTQRADIKCHKLPIYLHVGYFPILAVKMDEVKDKGATSRNINLDTKAIDSNGTEYKGLLSGNNKYVHELKCSDGSHVFIYDYSETAAPTNSWLQFSLFQIKHADMKGLDHQIQYNLYWVQTFKSVADVENYVKNVDKLDITTIK